MIANVIEYGGNSCVVDGCFEFTCTDERIEHIVDEVNQALLKGELSMTGAYYTVLCSVGCEDKLAKALSYHHKYGRKIILENNFWEEED
jgi:hypothetical protein